jgi:hypothetical protein
MFELAFDGYGDAFRVAQYASMMAFLEHPDVAVHFTSCIYSSEQWNQYIPATIELLHS